MNISFEGKVALITGAASGLATAQAFAAVGAAVTLAGWNEKEVQDAAKKLADKGFKTLAVRCDVLYDAEVEAMVKATVAKFGRLDAAYNNADYISSRPGSGQRSHAGAGLRGADAACLLCRLALRFLSAARGERSL